MAQEVVHHIEEKLKTHSRSKGEGKTSTSILMEAAAV